MDYKKTTLKRLLICFYVLVISSRTGTVFGEVGIPYQVRIEGIDDPQLISILKDLSDTWELQKRPPASLTLLRQRVNRDLPVFIRALKSEGFYGNQVEAQINTKSEKVEVNFQINPGPPYLLKSFDVQFEGAFDPPGLKLPENNELGLVPGKPAKSKIIINAGKELIHRLEKEGFPFPELKERKVIVDHAQKEVSVLFRLDPGQKAFFGSTEIIGLDSIDKEFIWNKLPWSEGDLFNILLLEKAKKTLTETGHFAQVQVKAAEILDKTGYLPIIITVKERKHRTAKIGLNYTTDEGYGGKVSWEHRNFFHRGERMQVMMNASEIFFSAESGFRKPEFFRTDQALLLNLRIAEERPDAFTSRNIRSSLQVERLLGKGMTLEAGVAFKASDTEQLDEG
ncbi:MAG: POTRA domain-containing protein [Pseudomonadota bacterium]